jgi:hypothetical protein
MNDPGRDQNVSNVMTEAQRWTVKCQDPADGSGDVIIRLPPNLLACLELSIVNVLTIRSDRRRDSSDSEVERLYYTLNRRRALPNPR